MSVPFASTGICKIKWNGAILPMLSRTGCWWRMRSWTNIWTQSRRNLLPVTSLLSYAIVLARCTRQRPKLSFSKSLFNKKTPRFKNRLATLFQRESDLTAISDTKTARLNLSPSVSQISRWATTLEIWVLWFTRRARTSLIWRSVGSAATVCLKKKARITQMSIRSKTFNLTSQHHNIIEFRRLCLHLARSHFWWRKRSSRPNQ